MDQNQTRSFEELKQRLDRIVELVNDENLPLDAALDLYEEAVSLGLEASSMLEEGVAANNAAYAEQAEEVASEADS